MTRASENPQRLLIYGAGGHGRVVLDAALASGDFRLCGLVDDNPEMHKKTLHGVPVLGGRDALGSPMAEGCRLVIGIGNPASRRRLAEGLAEDGWTFASVIHPSAVIGLGAEIGEGSTVLPTAVLHTDARLGRHVIVNTASTVDHDARIGDYVHIAPGAHIGGGVHIGARTLVGIGASIIPGVRIGEGVVLGAGAVVIGDVPDGAVVVGVLARSIRKDDRGRA